MVEAGNAVGTDGTPPQVPPNSAAAGSEVESVQRPGGAKRAAGCWVNRMKLLVALSVEG